MRKRPEEEAVFSALLKQVKVRFFTVSLYVPTVFIPMGTRGKSQFVLKSLVLSGAEIISFT